MVRLKYHFTYTTFTLSSTMHIYEPVPDFYKNLEKVWSDHSASNQWRVSVHNFGLGEENRTVLLSEADLRGQGTFGMKNTEEDEGQKIPLDIIEASVVVRNVTEGVEALDLLHVNCEGCEYEMLENIIRANLHTKIRLGLIYLLTSDCKCVLTG